MTRAPYASDPALSRGRRFPESESPMRSPFQRDRDRIIHCTAFRRLKHKTQVFIYHEGDHYRTRLTHSLEVAQIARSLARALQLDEDLAEALALAHDLGHPPFGHAGEEALDACMADFGGFDHNEQTFRVLVLLERRYADFDGLNLTWESLEGIVKHNGPLRGRHASAKTLAKGVPATIAGFSAAWNLDLDGFAGPEAQVAALADDIAYNNHDLDDGLRAGLFAIGDLADLPLAGDIFAAVLRRHPGLETQRLIHESIRRMIDHMIGDAIGETRRRLADGGIADIAAIRAHDRPVVAFSPAMREGEIALKRFLFERMYRHARVNRSMEKARQVLSDLFRIHMENPALLPEEWRGALPAGAGGEPAGDFAIPRRIADYIAGMTDKFALSCHRRHFGATILTEDL